MTDSLTDRDYRDTLFLPATEFPMRGGLPKREPEWIKRWDELQLYDRLRADAKARGAKQWILHDGPPYANGPIHLGTAMQKILKDIVVRSHQMAGFDAARARERFQIPEGYDPVSTIAIGFPGQPERLPDKLQERELAPRERSPQRAFLFAEQWGVASPLTEDPRPKS